MNLHPAMGYELANAKITDMHRQAERDRIAREARRARSARDTWSPGDAEAGEAIRALLTVLCDELERDGNERHGLHDQLGTPGQARPSRQGPGGYVTVARRALDVLLARNN